MSYGTVQAEKMTTESGYSLGAGNASSFKNRLINGNMAIDQRNAGASAANTGGGLGYFLDRWGGFNSDASKYTVQQNAGSVTPPANFNYYLGITSSSAFSLGSTSQFQMGQAIEGYNMADFGWGTANAKPITLSFWVRSSLTGAFAVAFRNSGSPSYRSYLSTFTVNSANTWEQKTITVSGDTGGTWNSANGAGMYLTFCLGAGSTFTTSTTGSWIAGNFINVTGVNNLVSVNGATLYITGVQIEVGTVASSFDFRPVGTELILCQRYFEEVNLGAVATSYITMGAAWTSSQTEGVIRWSVAKRATPSCTVVNQVRYIGMGGSPSQEATSLIDTPSTVAGLVYSNSVTGFTAGQPVRINVNTAGTTKIQVSAEL